MTPEEKPMVSKRELAQLKKCAKKRGGKLSSIDHESCFITFKIGSPSQMIWFSDDVIGKNESQLDRLINNCVIYVLNVQINVNRVLIRDLNKRNEELRGAKRS